MRVIVLAQENDNHTAPIKWALEKGGYQVACWGGLSWTEQQQVSLLLDDQSKMVLGPYAVEPGDAVWIRRPDQPVPNPKVSEADRKFAELEYRSFYHCIAYTLELLPVWVVNRPVSTAFVPCEVSSSNTSISGGQAPLSGSSQKALLIPVPPAGS